MATASRRDKAAPASAGSSPEDADRPPLRKILAAGSSVREMNDEFVPALSRDRLGGRFGDFSGGIMAKLVPIVVAHHPVVEIVVRNNVNSGGCPPPNSPQRS